MGNVLLRDKAKRAGQKRYLGADCIRGHGGERFVSSNGCVECAATHQQRYYREDPERYREHARRHLAKVKAGEEFWLKARERDRDRDQTPERKAWRAARRARPDQKEAKRLYDASYRQREVVRQKKAAETKTSHYRDVRNKAEAARRKSVPAVKLAHSLRVRLGKALRGKGTASATKLLGCAVNEARLHLEAKFLPGMSWANHGRDGWHIDHIRPLVSFDLTDPEQVAAACHFSNLQPLWAADNIRKGAKIAA